jgi:hypothetical protein
MEIPHLWTAIASAVVVFLAIVCFVPALGERFFTPIEVFTSRIAHRKGLSIFVVAVAPIAIRLSLLWWLPVPVPSVHDEFSYLLAADTFAHGRLTNPPHPMWIYFETFHVNQHPTYMSKYPPAQGGFLALGQLLGHPWIGVLLSVGLMCGAIVWMLQGWLPPKWALLGGVLVAFRLGIFTYWVNSYWGGAVAAIGGALVVGALPRVMRARRARDAVIMTLGVAILANSRPLEGLIFCVPVLIALGIWLFSRRSGPARETAARFFLPAGAVLALAIVFMGYYNWRGTGHPLLFPYVVNSRSYMTVPQLAWEKGRAPIHYLNPQFDAFYNDQEQGIVAAGKATSLYRTRLILQYDAGRLGSFFLWPELCVPLIALPWILADRRVRFLVVQFVFCFLGFLLVVWFLEHYAAPLTATIFGLVVQGLRHVRRWRFRAYRVGVGITRAVFVACVLFAAWSTYAARGDNSGEDRARIVRQLDRMSGKQLVLVRYFDDHDPNDEWVYNRANIDGSKIVWAREIPGVPLQPLLSYFHDRRVWVVTPDKDDPELAPYDPSSD